MMSHMLETNICICVINTRPPQVLKRFRKEQLGSICVSSVIAADLAFGVSKSGSSRKREALEIFLATLEVLPFDNGEMWSYADLRAELERRGEPIGAVDTMIAAYAME